MQNPTLDKSMHQYTKPDFILTDAKPDFRQSAQLYTQPDFRLRDATPDFGQKHAAVYKTRL
jgi:hypothetical protein